MKSIYYLTFIVLIISSCSESTFQNNATISFILKEYDFGTIKFNQKAEYNFIFTNSGKEPLIIQNVETSCGCTVPEWTKEFVKHGEKGKITIKYDTSRPGKFFKYIKVFFNGKDSPIELTIKGNVEFP